MTFSHDDIRDRLVDYLYGQLDDEPRAAFEAHLASCEACRDEVSGAERARAVAREVVRRPLAEPVPERVRARAAEAARAAVAARAAPAAPASARAGWFHLLRRRWTFPTFATVAAMAVFLLVRATIFREAQHPVTEQLARELEKPAPPSAPVPEAAPAESAPDDLQAARRNAAAARDAEDRLVPAKGASSVEQRNAAASAPARRPSGGTAHRHQPSPGGRSSGGSAAAPRAAAPPPASAAAPKRASKRDLSQFELDELAGSSGPGQPKDRDREQKAGAAREERARAVPQSAPPVMEREQAQRQSEDRLLAADEPAEKPRKKSDTTKSKEPIAAAPPAAQASAAPASVDPALQLVARAQGFMDAHRWRDAITGYGELLRRYPQHRLASEWRRRLAAAQAALAADTGRLATPPP